MSDDFEALEEIADMMAKPVLVDDNPQARSAKAKRAGRRYFAGVRRHAAAAVRTPRWRRSYRGPLLIPVVREGGDE